MSSDIETWPKPSSKPARRTMGLQVLHLKNRWFWRM